MSAHAGGLPPGWFVAGAEDAFTASTTPGACKVATSVELSANPGVTSGWATVMQLLDATPWRGRRVRLAATVTTREVKGWAGVWMRVDGVEAHRALAFDNMQTRPLVGTTPCAVSEVVLDVAPDAVTIAAGVVLEGAGGLELSGPRLEVVPVTVAVTDLLGRKGFKPGAPGLSPEERPNELEDSLGRVGVAWFNTLAVQNATTVLHQRNPARWSDSAHDAVATREPGGLLKVRLGAFEGLLRFRREGDATVIEGEWGRQLKYPASIRLTRDRLDMKWGFYERHLEREDAPQVEPGCVRFVQYKGTTISASDAMYVCGLAFGDDAPVQVTVAFLLNGFQRTRSGPSGLPVPGIR